jgi:hypothetical protein
MEQAMNKRSLGWALRDLVGCLHYLGGLARKSEREPWQGTILSNIADCRQAYEVVVSSLRSDPEYLEPVRLLLEKCYANYQQGEFDAGEMATRDIEELVAGIVELDSPRPPRPH